MRSAAISAFCPTSIRRPLEALLALRDAIDAHGRAEGVHLVAWKDLAPDDAEPFEPFLKEGGLSASAACR